MSEVKIGQVYRDKDKRMKGRHVLVMDTFRAMNAANYARCFASSPDGEIINKRTVTLEFHTLQTRFELVKDVNGF